MLIFDRIVAHGGAGVAATGILRRGRECDLVTKATTEPKRDERQKLMPRAFTVFCMLAVALALCPRSARAQEKPASFEVAPVFSSYYEAPGFFAGSDQYQLGGRFTWNWLPHLSLEAEYTSTLEQAPLETQFVGGYFSQALFGVKSGVRWKRWGVFAKFRPGFISYSNVITAENSTTGEFTFGRLTNEAFDSGGGVEFFLSRHWLFRYDASALTIHEGTLHLTDNGIQGTFSPFTLTRFHAEVGVAFRF